MFNHLSIFSFDTLTEIPKPNRVFILTVIILLVVRFIVSNNGITFENMAENSNLAPVMNYIEKSNRFEPEVIFFGSSRFQSCINSDLFSRLLSKDKMDVVNLSVASGTAWEASLLCRKYPWITESVQLIIIEVEPWMFNANMVHPILKKRYEIEPYFQRWATLEERLAIPDIKIKTKLLINYLWPFYEKRSLISWYSTIQHFSSSNDKSANLPYFIYHYNQRAAKALAAHPAFKARPIAQCHLSNFEFAYHKGNYLLTVLDYLKNTKAKIVLLQPPVRKEYMDVIYNNPQYLSTYKKIRSFLQTLKSKTVEIVIWETPENCGLNNSIFIDYGHFNKKGADLFTKVLAYHVAH